jgi:putative flippase GtrA
MVGLTAAAIHLTLVIILVRYTQLVPLPANVIAFLVAFNCSYLGHRHWTFNVAHINHRSSLPRFFSIAVLNFALNEGGYFLLLHHTPLSYVVALLVVLLIVPVVTFTLSKVWAFT